MDGYAAAAFDPHPAPTLALDDPRIIAPGTSRTLDGESLRGEFGRGEALYFYWYLPEGTTAEGEVVFRSAGGAEFTYAALEEQSYEVYYEP